MKHQSIAINAAGMSGVREDRSLYWAAVSSALAGVIHAWFAPEHFEEWFGYGAFFVTVAAAQFIFAVLLLHRQPTRRLLLAGVIGNALILMLYVLTRTLGIPIGPQAGEIEAFGMLDALATISEAILIAYLLLLVSRRDWSEVPSSPAASF